MGAGKVFGELWMHDTVIEEVDTVIEDFGDEIKKQEELPQPMSNPKNITIYGGKQHP